MIHYLKDLDLGITDSKYHHDPTQLGETIPSQSSNPQICRDYKSFEQTYTGYIIGKVLTWRSQILIITMVRHPQSKLYNLKRQTPKHVEVIRTSEKPTFDTSLERSRPGINRFYLSP